MVRGGCNHSHSEAFLIVREGSVFGRQPGRSAHLSAFEEMRPKTPRAGVLQRERELTKQLERLLKIRDEKTYIEGLEKDFGITKDHKNYRLMMQIWRDQQHD
jgi:hypothetical protein